MLLVLPQQRSGAEGAACGALAPLRYTAFIGLYPLGVLAEIKSVWDALPLITSRGLHSLALPNAWNFAFDYGLFLKVRARTLRRRTAEQLGHKSKLTGWTGGRGGRPSSCLLGCPEVRAWWCTGRHFHVSLHTAGPRLSRQLARDIWARGLAAGVGGCGDLYSGSSLLSPCRRCCCWRTPCSGCSSTSSSSASVARSWGAAPTTRRRECTSCGAEPCCNVIARLRWGWRVDLRAHSKWAVYTFGSPTICRRIHPSTHYLLHYLHGVRCK